MTVTPLGRDQDCSLKNREPDVLALLVPGSWRLEQDRRGWTVLHLPWNLYPVPWAGWSQAESSEVPLRQLDKKQKPSYMQPIDACISALRNTIIYWNIKTGPGA
ncbi:hypothetical protein STEG23_032268, partial [Scotinomys teguina]